MPLPAFVIPAALSAAGAIGNLFGGDDETYDREYLKRMGYNFMDVGKSKGDLARMISARIKGRRSGMDAKNSQMGLNNPTDLYSNEEDLINAEQSGMSQIDEQKRKEDQAVAMTLTQMNMGRDDESDFSKIFEGGLAGANLGFGIQGILDKGLGDPADKPVKLDPNKVQPTANSTPYTSIMNKDQMMQDWFKQILSRQKLTFE